MLNLSHAQAGKIRYSRVTNVTHQ